MANYTHNAPWYYAADGIPVQAVATEEGWTYPLAPVDDDGAQIRVIDDPAAVSALNTQALGFNPDDKRVNQDGSVSIMNPQTQQYEQAVAAGESGALMPVSMAQAQNLPIYQYAKEPKEPGGGALGQLKDMTIDSGAYMPFAMAAGVNALGGANMFGTNPGALGIDGITASVADGVGATNAASNAVSNGALGGAEVMAGAADPIEALHMAMNATGTETASAAANALGFATPEAMVASVNPAWAGAAGAAGGALGGSGAATGTGAATTSAGAAGGGALSGTGAATTAAGAAATAAGSTTAQDAIDDAEAGKTFTESGGTIPQGSGGGGVYTPGQSAGLISKLTGIINGTKSWSDLSTSDLMSLGLLGGGLLESATKDTSTSNKVELPEWYTEASKKAIALADAQAAKPFTAFGGEAVAPLAENEKLAIQMAKDSAGNWKPLLDEASDMTRASTQSIKDMDLNAYMNPYLELVYGPQKRQLERDIAQAKIANDAKAGMRGAFGTSRGAIENSLLDERKFNALSDLYGNAYSSAFNNATTLATGDLSRKAAAGGALTSQAGATSALTGSDIGRLGTTGTVDRSVRQAGDDFAVSEFKREQDDTKKKIEGYTSALRGNPGSTTTTTPPSPSLLTQGVGALTALNGADKLGWFS